MSKDATQTTSPQGSVGDREDQIPEDVTEVCPVLLDSTDVPSIQHLCLLPDLRQKTANINHRPYQRPTIHSTLWPKNNTPRTLIRLATSTLPLPPPQPPALSISVSTRQTAPTRPSHLAHTAPEIEAPVLPFHPSSHLEDPSSHRQPLTSTL